MVEKVFWSDPYQTRLATRVASVEGDAVTLEETVFFAFSGGQESDQGSIAGRPVLEARKEGHEIFYTLPPEHGLCPGDRVEVAIDWDRRYRLMRLHFAAELVLELIYRRLKGVEKTGAHISADKARIDFAWPESIGPVLPEIWEGVQGIVGADAEIESGFSDRAAGRRYWRIQGLAQVACGGTHLKKTGEVGRVRLKRRNPGQGRERVEIYLED